MNFRTKISIEKAAVEVSYASRILMLGSCFTDNIGKKLQQAKFKVAINPFGIQYNPLSVAQALQYLVEKKQFGTSDLFLHQDRWHSFMHHSSFSASTPDATLTEINSRLFLAAASLPKTDIVFISFGTAWVYTLKDNGAVVSNCHKLPDSLFIRRRLTVDEIVSAFVPLLQKVESINPNIQVVFTVSPIRHWKDGPHENNLSKSILLLAIEALQKTMKTVSYFPAYELLLDDLRDYRFYTEDMMHPNSTAIAYIWEKFGDSYFTGSTKELVGEMEKLTKMELHRPFNTESEAYEMFCAQMEQKKAAIKKRFVEFDFEF